ncbi:hypothetical protein [Paenarthrobacter sp. NPDC057981]|uniref:hypothetical protein n=1 Tax=Paenarthrobacter sp. NPDC057981 TaxID=3346297 RepID=UPI0036DF8E8E
MAPETPAPKYLNPSFACPLCGALAAQEWRDLYVSNGKGGFRYLEDRRRLDMKPAAGPQFIDPRWAASECYACGNQSIWLHGSLVYPDPLSARVAVAHAPHEEMPADAADLFREAVAVLPFSRRAAAALCRASMERLVKFLDPECPRRAKLDERLVRLEGRLSTSTIDLLNVLRHVGNTALHGEQDGDGSATIYIDEDDETIAETFFLVINTLVDELITKPRRTAELYGALPEGVRNAYESKAGRVGG